MFRAPVNWRVFRDGDELRGRLWRAQTKARHLAMGAQIRAEMYPEPQPAARPVILMRQREAVGDQMPAACGGLVKVAQANGWEAKATYTLVSRDAKMIETCVCWLRRGRLRGNAGWERVDGGAWSFVSAWCCGYRFGWQRSKGSDKATIKDMLAMLGKPNQSSVSDVKA
jgi:hypothetical protein